MSYVAPQPIILLPFDTISLSVRLWGGQADEGGEGKRKKREEDSRFPSTPKSRLIPGIEKIKEN